MCPASSRTSAASRPIAPLPLPCQRSIVARTPHGLVAGRCRCRHRLYRPVLLEQARVKRVEIVEQALEAEPPDHVPLTLLSEAPCKGAVVELQCGRRALQRRAQLAVAHDDEVGLLVSAEHRGHSQESIDTLDRNEPRDQRDDGRTGGNPEALSRFLTATSPLGLSDEER